MSPPQRVNSLLAYITPRSPFISDLDPEDEQPGPPDLTGDVVEAREHYVEVGWVLLHICPTRVKPTECFRPSTLRRHLDSIIDPKYVGVKTSRKQLEEHDALGDLPDQDESASQSISSEGSASEEDEGEEKVQSPDKEEASEDEQSTQKNNQVIQENSSHEKDLATTVRQRRDEDRKKGRAVTKQLVSIAWCRCVPSLQTPLLQLESLGQSTRCPYTSTKVCHSV
jgi:protein AATF/BFR2